MCAWRLDQTRRPHPQVLFSFNLIQMGGPSLSHTWHTCQASFKDPMGKIKQLPFLPFSSLLISLHPQMPNKELENLENPLTSSNMVREQGRGLLLKRLAWIANQPSYTYSTHLKTFLGPLPKVGWWWLPHTASGHCEGTTVNMYP